MSHRPSNPAPGERGTFIQSIEKRKRELALVATLLAPAALAACSGEAQANGPTVSHSAEATPSASATPTPEATTPNPDRYEGADFELKEPLPAELEYLNALKPAEFALEPKRVQLQWATWAEQYKDAFNTMFVAVSGDPTYDGPYTLALDSDPITALKENQTVLRIADNMGTGTPSGRQFNGALDEDMYKKIVIAHSYTSNTVQADQMFASASAADSGQALNVVQQAAKDTYNIAQKAAEASDFTSKDVIIQLDDGTVVKAHEVNFTSPDGSNFNDVIGVVPITNFKGEPVLTVVYG
ncbi:MAG: hypothetical protein WAQ27_05015 [Candidatus Microsaccharimonas sp.]